MDNSINNTAPVENKIIPRKSFKNKKLFIIVGITLLIITSLLILFINKKQASNTADTTVELKTEYENPFDEKTQYKNPFSQEEYQNPFDFGQ